jgi:hypothetical protein
MPRERPSGSGEMNDPIFTAIELYQSARATWLANTEHDCGCDAACHAWHVLKKMTPRTTAGFVAKLRVFAAEDTMDQEEDGPEDILWTIFKDFAALDRAAQPAQPAAAT